MTIPKYILCNISAELMWVIGGLSGVFLLAIIAAIKSHSDLSTRVTKLEAVMALFGQKAAKILHSPHDPYGIDYLLDKYLDRHYELTIMEWEALWHQCELIEEDKSKPKDERTLAAWLSAVAQHKLFKPPKARKKFDIDFINETC